MQFDDMRIFLGEIALETVCWSMSFPGVKTWGELGNLGELELSSTNLPDALGGATGTHCKHCGNVLRRLPRISFWQRRIYPLFGYYPWECPICRKLVMLKKQYRRKSRSSRPTSAD
jgi:hypothetical protein